MARKSDRDHWVLEAYLNGCTKEELAAKLELSVERIGAIITSERHRRMHSPALFYKQLRKAVSEPV